MASSSGCLTGLSLEKAVRPVVGAVGTKIELCRFESIGWSRHGDIDRGLLEKVKGRLM